MRLKSIRLTFIVSAVLLGCFNLVSIANSLKNISQVAAESHKIARKQIQHKRPSIVLFGDSLTQRGFGEAGNVGWASLLASAYIRRADVKNRGFGGYNTHHALHVWPEIEEAFEGPILFSTLFFGANDAALPGNPQHLSLEDFRDNLVELITKIRAKVKTIPSPPIFLFTPPPVDEAPWAKARNAKESNRRNDVTRTYGDVVRQVAREQELPVVDTWDMLDGTNQTAYSHYLSDGVHLNEEGNRRIYQGFLDILQRDFPNLAPKTDLHPQGMPFQHKKWQDYQ